MVTCLRYILNSLYLPILYPFSRMLQYEEETNFLHGSLKIHVIAARDLPDIDSTFFNVNRGDWTDPYAAIYLDQTELCKTAVFQNDLNPVWDEVFSIPVCHHANNIKIKVMDREHIGAETVGTILISTDDVIEGEAIEDGMSSLCQMMVIPRVLCILCFNSFPLEV